MTDTLNEDHAQGLLGPLQADAALTVYRGEVPAPYSGHRPPYVLVRIQVTWPADGAADAIDHRSVTCVTRGYCYCTGETEAAALAVDMQVRATLLNLRPTVAGRNCGLTRQIDSNMPGIDESLGIAVFTALAVYEFTSAPG